MGGTTEMVIYRETEYLLPWVAAMVAGLLLLLLVVMVGAIVKGYTGDAVLMGACCAFLLFVIANFGRLVFVITDRRVIFGFGLFLRKFERGRVSLCEPYELTFGNYLGYGIRFGRDGSLAYNTRNGPGVRLVVDGKKRPYVVSIRGAGEVCRILGPGRE